MTDLRHTDARIDLLRVVGALSVFAYHFMSDATTVLRLPMADSALWRLVQEGAGPFGVAVFLMISGIVFSWTWPRTSGPQASSGFVRRRLVALFPFYWWVSVPLIAAALLAHRMTWLEIWKVPLWLTGLGVLSPTTFFPVIDAWWYMSLALQFVFLYPCLRRAQDAIGLDAFLALSGAISVASIWALRGLHLEYAILGFAGCRLLEFAFGMTIGRLMAPAERMRVPRLTLAVAGIAAVGYLLASPGSVVLAVVAPMFVVSTLVFMANPMGGLARLTSGAATISFAFYLSHSPWAKLILPAVEIGSSPVQTVVLGATLSLLTAVSVAGLFWWSFAWVKDRLRCPGTVAGYRA